MFKVVISTTCAFLFFLCIHFAHFHFFEPYDRVNSVIGAAFVGYGLFLILHFFLPSEDSLLRTLKLSLEGVRKALPLLLGTILFFLLFVGYLEFYFTADRSITFRMLRITDERPMQTITAAEMLSEYDTQGIIVRRLDDLVYGGYLREENGQYSVTPKGQRVLALYRFTIDFLHMRKY